MKKNIISFLIFLISLPLFADETNLFSPLGIAEIHIDLLNGKNIDDIKRDETNLIADKLDATMVIKNSRLSIYNAPDLYNGRIQIKGRGNTTWGVPKRPYAIDLVTESGDDNPSALLGMPADEEWVLLAFWHDRSMMRNPLAYYLGRQMTGLEYSPRFKYVEVYINGEYRGLYMLCEKIKRADQRVNISKLTTDVADQVAPQLSGGYLLEVTPSDRVKMDEVSARFKTTKRDINFVIKYPKPKNVTTIQVQWMKSYMDEFETVLYGDNFKDPVTGYLKYINENSFIDWYIIHDLSKGVDNLFHASLYLHKDRNGKLNMSSPWDFDISFGNVGSDCFFENELWIQKTHYFNRLMQDERFAKKLVARYDELQPLFNKIPEVLETNFKQLESEGCLDRDYDRWPQILGDYKDKEGRTTPNTVKGHVRWFKEWLESRQTWLYINYGLTEVDRCDRLKKSKPIIRIMDPSGFEMGGNSSAKVMKGYTYIWNGTSVTSNENYQFDKDGKNWVQIKDVHGCTSLPSKSIARGDTEDQETSLQQINPDAISIYSGSSKDVLYISYASYKESLMNISLYGLQGTFIKQVKYQVAAGLNRYQLNISGLQNGIYLIKCSVESEVFMKKVIVTN